MKCTDEVISEIKSYVHLYIDPNIAKNSMLHQKDMKKDITDNINIHVLTEDIATVNTVVFL